MFHRQVISDTAFSHLKEVFMDAFDDNDDDRIEMAEMAAILPTDENFFLLFRHNNPLESSVEFMRVWRAYDKDCSGYIEADELKVTTVTAATLTSVDARTETAASALQLLLFARSFMTCSYNLFIKL